MSPQLARAARYVADHPEQVAVGSLRALARTLGVSPATMTRLARTLGHASYDALRRESAAALARQGGYAHRAQRLQDAAKPPANPLAALSQAQVAAVQSVPAVNSERQIESFCRALLRARRVGFLGLRSSHAIAFQFSYVYGFLFDNGVLLGDAAGALLDDAGRLTARDALVAITVAPYTRASLECVCSAADRGVPILAITDSSASPLGRYAKHALTVDTESPSFFSTMAGLLACVETLVLRLALQQGERAVERLAAIDERLRRAGAYEDTGWRRNLKVSA
ncbi:MAG: MurR/RpiR family transcriptional regulator [Burkholderiales bacterium]